MKVLTSSASVYTYPERFEAAYGPWRPVVDEAVEKFLACGDLHLGFARVRCPD